MIDVYGRFLVIILTLFVLGMTCSVGFAASPPRMRPYTGIGLVVFSADNAQNQDLQLPLYAEPGLSRVGMLSSLKISGNEWVFALPEGTSLFIVSARKGDWVKVFYDDAGREAWIEPQNKGHFQSWEQFLKLQAGRLLPGLQQQYYQLLERPGRKQLKVMLPKDKFRVLKLENSWSMVLTDQSQIGWVRWRDDDGRLTVGTGMK